MTMFKTRISFVMFLFILGMGIFSGGFVRADSKSELGALLPESKGDKQVGPVYLQLNYPNLVRLAWARGAYNTSDLKAIDNYLMITECSLYEKFYSNEFEWEKIRKAAVKYLDTYGKRVSMYYEYTQPLLLDRYDDALQGFPIENSTEYISLKTLQMASYRPGDTECGLMSVDYITYPSGAAINIISPLSLTFIRVPKKIAMEYISWRAKQGLGKSKERQAYIKYRVRIDGMEPKPKDVGGGYSFIFSGRVMQVDVFADEEMLMPLYNQLF